MCGCSSNFNGMERDIVTQDEFNRGFDFTGNRPSIIEVGEDPSFDFTGNRPSIIEVGEDTPKFDFMGDLDGQTEFDNFGGGRKAKRQERKTRRAERKANNQSQKVKVDPVTGEEIVDPVTGEDMVDPVTGEPKTTYGQGDWFSRNWIWLVLGVAVVGGGFYFYKKRK